MCPPWPVGRVLNGVCDTHTLRVAVIEPVPVCSLWPDVCGVGGEVGARTKDGPDDLIFIY